MSTSRRPEFGLSPSKKNHLRRGRKAKQARQERAAERRAAHPKMYQDIQGENK